MDAYNVEVCAVLEDVPKDGAEALSRGEDAFRWREGDEKSRPCGGNGLVAPAAADLPE